MKSDVVTSSKRWLCRDRYSYRVDTATSIQEQKYAVYCTLPVFKSGTVYTECLKLCHFSISFSKEMVGLFDFLFVRKLFLGVRHSNNWILKFLV